MSGQTPEMLIEQIRRDKFGFQSDGTKLTHPLEIDLRAAISHLAEDLNAKESHFILELLQNAEDNTYPPNTGPELHIFVDAHDPTDSGGDGCLCVLNNETGFTEMQVSALCSVGRSTKTKAQGYIGEKGIGFKSVFRVTDQPHIFSNCYQFRFQKPRGPDDLGYIVPHWVTKVPEIAAPEFTTILLPLIAEKRGRITQELAVIPPETILFLTKIRRLCLDKDRSIVRDKLEGFIQLSADGMDTRYFVYREACERPSNLIEVKREGINERQVTIALPLDSPDECDGRVFAFLPTEVCTGFPFLINADFLLSASRDSLLEDRSWNKWLRRCIAPSFCRAFMTLLRHSDWSVAAYRYLPIESDLQSGADFFAPVVAEIQKELQSQPCVLTDSRDFALPSQTFFASALARKILVEAPPKLARIRLVHPDLEKHKERLEAIGVRSLSLDHFLKICNDVEWLQQRKTEWWVLFFDWLSRCGVSNSQINDFPIFPCKDGVYRAPAEGSVFYDGNSESFSIPPDWPPIHFMQSELEIRVHAKPRACC